jgi:hypothetical protein
MRFSMSQMTTYYEANKAECLAYSQQIVVCPCGHRVKRQGLPSHRKYSPSHKIWADMLKSLEGKQQAQHNTLQHDSPSLEVPVRS